MEFDEYLSELAKHEKEKYGKYMEDPRKAILVHAGIALNWLGDFFANENIKWEKLTVPVDEILFTGTNPKTNEILLEKCERQPKNLIPHLEENQEDKEYIESVASYGDEPILLRKREEFFLVLDGMHRFTGAVLEKQDTVEAYVATNDHEVLPECEPHVIYDLIRGYQRHAKDEDGKEDLYHGLRLLNRTYANVGTLLKERFNKKYVNDDDVQEVIRKVLKSNHV